MTITPLGNYVLIRPDPQETTTETGLAKVSYGKPQTGVIEALPPIYNEFGPAFLYDAATQNEYHLQVGMRVIYARDFGHEYGEYLLLGVSDLLGVVS